MQELDLSQKQIEALLKLEYYKTLYDIKSTPCTPDNHTIRDLKQAWLDNWMAGIREGFPDFVQDKSTMLNMQADEKLMSQEIDKLNLEQSELQIVLIGAMIFEPYFPITIRENEEEKYEISKDYVTLKYSEDKFVEENGDRCLDNLIAKERFGEGYFQKLRFCYDRSVEDLQKKYRLPSRPLFLHLVYSIIPMEYTMKSNDQISMELIGLKFTDVKSEHIIDVIMAYLGSGIVAASSIGNKRGDKGSLGIGNSQNYVRGLKEGLLSSILLNME